MPRLCPSAASTSPPPPTKRNLQLEKAKTLYQFCLNEGSVDGVIGFVKHHLTSDPERTDIVHDLLGFLAAQMLKMNKAKREEIRGFLHWLERESGAKIEALQNKTAIQSYFDLSLDDLLGILKKKPSLHPNRSIKPRFPRIAGARVYRQPRQTHPLAHPHSGYRRAY